MEDIIFELSELEKDWWSKTVKSYRSKIVKSPKHYAGMAFDQIAPTIENFKSNPDQVIRTLRESAWGIYIKDECDFHNKIISHLVESRDVPKNLLTKLISNKFFENETNWADTNLLSQKITSLVGDFSGRIMPYFYYLSLSTTNSRRTRAGKTLENIVERLMSITNYPFENQASLGTAFFTRNNLSKLVDLVIPGKEAFNKNRGQCIFLSMKTTLRERWQEVVEELNRTNIPQIYLLTLDETITSNVINTLSQHNVILVIYDKEKETKFTNFDNVKGMTQFFFHEIPHYLSYWK